MLATPTAQMAIREAVRPEEKLSGPLEVATLETPACTRVLSVTGREGVVKGRTKDALLVRWDGHSQDIEVRHPEALFVLPETVELTPAGLDALAADLDAVAADLADNPQGDIAAGVALAAEPEELVRYLRRQMEWSATTFGPGRRTVGISRHICKELNEIAADPTNAKEWCDVVILALDGAWRAGHTPEEIVAALAEKQRENFARRWPAPGPEDQPTEHLRPSDSSDPTEPSDLPTWKDAIATMKAALEETVRLCDAFEGTLDLAAQEQRIRTDCLKRIAELAGEHRDEDPLMMELDRLANMGLHSGAIVAARLTPAAPPVAAADARE